jgi:hypothetical protein
MGHEQRKFGRMAQPAGNLSSFGASAKKHVCPGWPDNGRTRVLRNHHAMEGGVPA